MQANLWELLVTQVLGTISIAGSPIAGTNRVTASEKVRHKVHRYDFAELGSAFAFEPLAESFGSYVMTAQRYGVSAGDRIEFRDASGTIIYRITEIEYYNDPSDMWMAKLRVYPS